MTRRPVIGIATQTLPAFTGERQTCWLMGRSYIEAMRAVGGVPWLIPLIPHDRDTLNEIFDRLDGVFITGGVDVDPACYGEPKSPLCGTIDPDRDAVEIALLKHALDRKLPVLAVCRGLQILNVACGGTLYQDVAAQVPAALKHDHFPTPEQPSRKFLAHDITVKSGSRLGKILGDAVVPVNSMHHQAIKDLAPSLAATAYAPDGIIEGVEGTGSQFVIAVQWHPEELTDTQPGMARLFTEFAAAAA
ncbi:MAG: gamma-glutamyl-gamma-aminobutyrate hydrolase family protein [Planctomycetes bacterium]|nr:gamma-glutamyl-gamma-aminobutyrate hydrolase family protein [Planctomycetota bacterium]